MTKSDCMLLITFLVCGCVCVLEGKKIERVERERIQKSRGSDSQTDIMAE